MQKVILLVLYQYDIPLCYKIYHPHPTPNTHTHNASLIHSKFHNLHNMPNFTSTVTGNIIEVYSVSNPDWHETRSKVRNIDITNVITICDIKHHKRRMTLLLNKQWIKLLWLSSICNFAYQSLSTCIPSFLY